MLIFGCKRRTMAFGAGGYRRVCNLPRKLLFFYVVVGVVLSFTMFIFIVSDSNLTSEDRLEQNVAEMQVRLEFLESMYRMRQEDFIELQTRIQAGRNGTPHHHTYETTTLSSEVLALLKTMNGSRAAHGIGHKHHIQRTPFVYQLLPHLMNDPNSLRPAYHMRSPKHSVHTVVGIPTVKRDKASYLITTLTHLIEGMADADANSTLLTVFVGETDLEYVLNTAKVIETTFPKQVEDGLIEVLSPSRSYYPDFDILEPTLGDSRKRAKWRNKQNLDTIYLMAYAQTRGSYYLMLEDDVLAEKNYMQDIRHYTASVSVSSPDWFFIEFCSLGGIGKLFKSSNLLHFITYVQLFYTNMPIDWLLESYLADRVCTINKTSKDCGRSKTEIRPKFRKSLFTHIGLYSSLKGKIQKVKFNEKNKTQDSHFGSRPTFYAHKNPPLKKLYSNIEVMSKDHSLMMAYQGKSFFWGMKPRKGSVLEFWFSKPIILESFTFRSANADHKNDKFYNTVVEVMTSSGNFTEVGEFDEFGLADEELKKGLGPLSAIRLRVLRDSPYWVILSEIELKPAKYSAR